jgi:hypothetical protein
MSTEKIVGQEVRLPCPAGMLPSAASPPICQSKWLKGTVQTNRAGRITGPLIAVFCIGSLSLALFSLVRPSEPDQAMLLQQGEMRLGAGAELVVYYPIPYPRIPNLEVRTASDCVIVEQQADHFRVRNLDPNTPATAQWKARGLQWTRPVAPLSATPEVEPEQGHLPCN